MKHMSFKEQIIFFTVFHMSGFLDPVGEVPHKVEEEVAVRNTDDLQSQKISV